MRYALSPISDKVEPTPGARAHCPICINPVLAKCGRINAWHWAHINQADCDTWSEPDSAWHLGWQGLFSATYREVTLGPHRADIAIPGGVLELQHSHLSVDEIRERETFYRQLGHFAWLFDAVDAYREDRINLRTKQDRPGQYRTFRWKHARKSIAAARAPVYLDLSTNDFGGAVLRLGRMHPKAPVGGWGYLLTREQFIVEFATDAYWKSQR